MKKLRVSWVGAVLWSLLALAVAGVVLFQVIKPPEKKVQENGERVVPVRVLEVRTRTAADRVRLSGRVEPVFYGTVAAEKAGRVVELAVDRGGEVEAGDLLLRVDAREWETALSRAEIQAREAGKELERWEALRESGAVSVSDFDAVQQAYDLAEAALRQARIDVDKCSVEAPAAGVVNERFVELGEYVNEAQPLFALADIDRVRMMFHVPERDVAAVRPGAEVSFTVDAVGEREFSAEVAFVAVRADPASNAFRVELEMDNPERTLKAGMIAQVRLERGVYRDAVVIPLAAVVNRKGEHIVFVVKDGRAVRRRVYLESMLGRDVVIRSGLEAGDLLVVEGHRSLQDGAAVEVQR